jgi:hypothetical protein
MQLRGERVALNRAIAVTITVHGNRERAELAERDGVWPV